jgi:hypothetical protein
MFNPFTKPSAVQLPPLSTTADDDPRNLNLPPEPPDVLSASSAVNPLYSTAVLWPGVVLQVRVGGGGEIEGLKAIKDVPPFTGAAQDAFSRPRILLDTEL